jgi:putative ABC transport system substrate-binding protein
MRRREFITLLGGAAAAWPLAARAQQAGKTYRIGFLSSFTAEGGKELTDCFRKGLEQLGWIEGRNIKSEYRWAGGIAERYAALAQELARLNLDLIVSNSTPAAQALQRVIRDVPVVFISVSDPVASGIVKSLARPEANITGFSNFLPATTGKLPELLKSVNPHLSRLIVFHNPDNPAKTLEIRELQASGFSLGMTIQPIELRNLEEIERAFSTLDQTNPVALVVLADGLTLSNRERIAELAVKNRLPAIYQTRDFTEVGGLMSYGLNFCQHFGRAAIYVDKILKGAKPADLPVELPTTFELVINLKAAHAIGLTIPESFLLRADEVIE